MDARRLPRFVAEMALIQRFENVHFSTPKIRITLGQNFDLNTKNSYFCPWESYFSVLKLSAQNKHNVCNKAPHKNAKLYTEKLDPSFATKT